MPDLPTQTILARANNLERWLLPSLKCEHRVRRSPRSGHRCVRRGQHNLERRALCNRGRPRLSSQVRPSV